MTGPAGPRDEAPDPAVPDDEAGTPVEQLRDFDLDADARFVDRVERAIGRRVLAGELTGLTLIAPATALLELLRIPFEMLDEGRTARVRDLAARDPRRRGARPSTDTGRDASGPDSTPDGA